MKINKEKLLKYIEDNFNRANVNFLLTKDSKPSIDIICDYKKLSWNREFFIIELHILAIFEDNKFFLKNTFHDNSLSPSNTIEITEDIYNELMKFASKNIDPQIQEFYKQICDEE